MTAPEVIGNAGKWDRWYGQLGSDPQPYGDTETYSVAARWVASCELVEDWGCGKGWMRNFIPAGRYRGVDGSHSPFVDQVVDLVDYRSDVPGIVMRHVLEHDYRWHLILENALVSARERICVVLYTPIVPYTRQIDFEDDPGVPVLAFRKEDITDRFEEAGFTVGDIESFEGTVNFGRETVIAGVKA